MRKSVMGPGWRWLSGVTFAATLAAGIGGAFVLSPNLEDGVVDEVLGGGFLLGLIAVGLWGLREVIRWIDLEWVLSDEAIEQLGGGRPSVRMTWDEVERVEHRHAVRVMRFVARDGRRIDLSCEARDSGLFMLEAERHWTEHRPPSPLPTTIEPAPGRAQRWLIAGAGLVTACALIPGLTDEVRAWAIGVGGLLAIGALLLWTVRREWARITVTADHLTARRGRRVDTFALHDLRGWLIQRNKRLALVLVTEDDSWELALPPRSWFAIAAAIRAATREHPQCAWIGEEVLAQHRVIEVALSSPPLQTPEHAHRTGCLRWGVAASALLVAIVASALTSAPPAPTALGRARRALTVGHPLAAIDELSPWLDEHPGHVAAHRVFVDAFIDQCGRRYGCDDEPAMARYAELRASEDPRLRELGAWGVARLEPFAGCRSGDPPNVIEALGAIDPSVIPSAPIERAALLEDAGRDDEAERALEQAMRGPLREEAASSLAASYLERGDQAALARLVVEVGPSVVGLRAVRALAADAGELGRWASAYQRELVAVPMALGVALAFGLAWLALARFWGGEHAPSWLATLGGASLGVALFVGGTLLEDALRLAGGGVLGDLRLTGVEAVFEIIAPLALAMAWTRGKGPPLGLVSRAGIIAAGVGASWWLDTALRSGWGLGFDMVLGWALLPLRTLAAPLAALWLVDLRQRDRSASFALIAALAVVALPWLGVEWLARAWPEVGTPARLCWIMFAAVAAFGPLLVNAAALSRSTETSTGERSVAAAFLGGTVVVTVAAFALATRELPLARMGPPAVAFGIFVVLPMALAPFCAVIAHRKWRSDWWRTRPGEWRPG